MLFHLPHLIGNCPFNIQRKRNGDKFSPCLTVILHKKSKVHCSISIARFFLSAWNSFVTRDKVSYYHIGSTRALWINFNF